MLRHIEIESWEEKVKSAVLLWFQSKVHLWHKVRKWCEQSERLFFKFLLYQNSRFLKRDYALVIDLSSDNYQFLPSFDFLVETRGALFSLPRSRPTSSWSPRSLAPTPFTVVVVEGLAPDSLLLFIYQTRLPHLPTYPTPQTWEDLGPKTQKRPFIQKCISSSSP